MAASSSYTSYDFNTQEQLLQPCINLICEISILRQTRWWAGLRKEGKLIVRLDWEMFIKPLLEVHTVPEQMDIRMLLGLSRDYQDSILQEYWTRLQSCWDTPNFLEDLDVSEDGLWRNLEESILNYYGKPKQAMQLVSSRWLLAGPVDDAITVRFRVWSEDICRFASSNPSFEDRVKRMEKNEGLDWSWNHGAKLYCFWFTRAALAGKKALLADDSRTDALIEEFRRQFHPSYCKCEKPCPSNAETPPLAKLKKAMVVFSLINAYPSLRMISHDISFRHPLFRNSKFGLTPGFIDKNVGQLYTYLHRASLEEQAFWMMVDPNSVDFIKLLPEPPRSIHDLEPLQAPPVPRASSSTDTD